MFNHHNGVARIAQLVQHFEEQVNVGVVQAGGGFVQYVQGAAGVALAQLQRQLDALRLAPRQGGGRLAQLDVRQAHIQQGLQLARNGRHGLHKVERRLHRQVQNLGNVAAFVGHL